MEKLREQTERIGYPILGVVSQLNALCRDRLGEYCHWGATTQDITDTATVMQIREGLAIVEADLATTPVANTGVFEVSEVIRADAPVEGRLIDACPCGATAMVAPRSVTSIPSGL